MKKIMILGAGIFQLPAIRKAKDFGYHVIVVDADPNAPGMIFAHEPVLISTIETEKILRIAAEKQIDGIMTLATDLPIRSVAAVAEKLSLPGISVDTAICATNKYMMRERLSQHRIPIPRFYKVSGLDEYYRITSLLNAKFIVKPIDNSGGRGIYLVQTESEKEKAFNHAHKYSRSGEILVEEFMVGREVSVETLSINGQANILAVTDKLTAGAPYFAEMGHSQPAQFDDRTLESIKRVAADAIRAVGIENGPSHTEIKVTEEGPKIVELGARLGGGCITTHLVPLSTGIDMVGCCLRLAMNEKPELKSKLRKASAIRFFNTHAGTIQSIIGVEQASSIKGICEIAFIKHEGDIINDIQSGIDRIGYVIAQGEKAHEAVSSCEKALNMITIAISAGVD
jgi:biotin carboxylase